MEINDALESGKFTVRSLTAAINNLIVPKTRIAELGIFEEKGIRTTTVDIEFKDGEIILVPETERGQDGTDVADSDRKVITIKAVHLPLLARIMADDVQNLRAFGSDDELEELDTLIDEKGEVHRLSLDATIEYHRIGAMLGKVMGAKGNVIINLFEAFGLDEAKAMNEIDFAKPLGSQLTQVVRDSEEHQAGIKGRRYRGLITPTLFDKFMDDETFVKAFERYNNAAGLREDVRGGIFWKGVYWEEFSTKLGDKSFIPEGEGIVFPEDKPKMFLTRFAPANYTETVNTTGLPYYGNSEPLSMNKGIAMESQSNPINVCTSPLAVRRIKIKA